MREASVERETGETRIILKVVLEMDKPQKSSRPVEFHEDVHIARIFLLTPHIGAEDPEVSNAITITEFREIRREVLPDLFDRPLFPGRNNFGHRDAPLSIMDGTVRCYIF